MVAGDVQVRIEPHLGAVGPGTERQHVQDVGDGVETVGWGECAGEFGGVADPVQAVHADGGAEMVVSDQVPTACVHDEPVRVHLACAAGVLDPDGVPRMDGRGQRQRQVRFRGQRACRRRGGGDQRGDASAQRRGQDAVEFDQRPVGRAGLSRLFVLLAGGQRDGDGDRFVIGEHQGRQAYAAGQPVAAVASADGLDGDVHVTQGGDVAANGAGVDVQAPGELVGRHQAAVLQELQQCQDAGRGTGHGSDFNEGRKRPQSSLALPR